MGFVQTLDALIFQAATIVFATRDMYQQLTEKDVEVSLAAL